MTVWRPSCDPATCTAPRIGKELLLPEIERQQKLGKEVVFRADAAFAKPEIYDALEERDVKYAIRIPANDSLERDIAELLTRPVGRPSHKPVVWYKSFLYQGSQLEKGAAGGGEGGVPLWRTVPSRGVHRHQSGDRQPGGGPGSTTSGAPQSNGSRKASRR